jgi:hypothetical protein
VYGLETAFGNPIFKKKFNQEENRDDLYAGIRDIKILIIF